ncbi:hypothetical protein [Anaeromicropila populeti]|uniref:Phage late control gene D protein (GPD) n=1 Tax=Anaeromicropila populeti TaxID=37658 RepID=A0A1I6KN55_9FIRM|nr:hypothetical protein [Anaeromicropila populeti]SFR92340.1 hypothetical protein SAMN05661086_02538 [Anaeromicropila populeti]
MASVIYHNIKVSCELPIVNIVELEINIKHNRHGKMYMKGYVDDELAYDDMEKELLNSKIKVEQVDESDSKREDTIFYGIVQNVDVEEENGFLAVKITAITASCNLDGPKKSRSFQNVSMTYADVVRKVIKETSGALVLCSIGADREIGKPLIQYQETDWEFIKRLASHFRSSVIPETTMCKPYFWFGMPNTNVTRTFKEHAYQAKLDKKYFELGGKNSGYMQGTFLKYIVTDKNNCNIGDKTNFLRQSMTICEKQVLFSKGELRFVYTLGNNQLIGMREYYNNVFSGLSIGATVKKTEGETVYLQLDIDTEETAKYPYKWTPPTGNMMYCMPQVGTKVSLYFPNYDERLAQATNSPRSNGESCAQMSDYNKRSLTTEHNKKMDMFPEQMTFSGTSQTDVPLQIDLNDDLHTLIESYKNLSIYATGPIKMEAPNVCIGSAVSLMLQQTAEAIAYVMSQILPVGTGKAFVGEGGGSNVTGETALQAYHAGGTAVLSLENRFDALGEHGIMMGWNYVTFEPFKDGPTVTKFDWLSAIGKALACIAVVAVVAVVAVAAGVVTGGVAAGAIIGAAVALACQVADDYKSGNVSSTWQYIKKALSGAISGALCAGIGGIYKGASIATKILVGGGAGAISSVSQTFMEHMCTLLPWDEGSLSDYSPTDYISSFIGGGLGGMLGEGFGMVFSKVAPTFNSKLTTMLFSKSNNGKTSSAIFKWVTRAGTSVKSLSYQLIPRGGGKGMDALVKFAQNSPDDFIKAVKPLKEMRELFIGLENNTVANNSANAISKIYTALFGNSDNGSDLEAKINEINGYFEQLDKVQNTYIYSLD